MDFRTTTFNVKFRSMQKKSATMSALFFRLPITIHVHQFADATLQNTDLVL